MTTDRPIASNRSIRRYNREICHLFQQTSRFTVSLCSLQKDCQMTITEILDSCQPKHAALNYHFVDDHSLRSSAIGLFKKKDPFVSTLMCAGRARKE